MEAVSTSKLTGLHRDSVTEGCLHEGDLEQSVDVVVIGSGSGGAVIAAELAEAGHEVLVLEEGPFVPSDEHAQMRPSQSIRRVWREAAMSAAIGLGDTPVVNVTMGRLVGGSSALTGGVCFRIPDRVLHSWVHEHGLDELSSQKLEPFHDRVEEYLGVTEVPKELHSRSLQLFSHGAELRGIEVKPTRRNIQDCSGIAQCNFGCPKGAKRSVDRSYLPRAARHGARVISDCLAERILVENGRAVGVRGRLLRGRAGKRAGRFTIHARRVVVAAGAWHGPLLLKASGVGRGSKHLGRNLTLHPACRMMARFKEPVHGWRGALQAAFVDAFEDEKLTMVSLFVPPGILAATLPGFGPEHSERAEQSAHIAVMGGLIHDVGGGVIRRTLGREPLVTYRMSRSDRAALPRLMEVMADTFAAAGAQEIFLPVLGHKPVTPDELRHLDIASIPARRYECASQHPLGSARMGTSPDNSVVDPNGRCWDTEELYIADGSILPTSLGVNPQVGVMTMATRIALRLRDTPLP
jgi:choline dehydrogenase-like flavoprotein